MTEDPYPLDKLHPNLQFINTELVPGHWFWDGQTIGAIYADGYNYRPPRHMVLTYHPELIPTNRKYSINRTCNMPTCIYPGHLKVVPKKNIHDIIGDKP